MNHLLNNSSTTGRLAKALQRSRLKPAPFTYKRSLSSATPHNDDTSHPSLSPTQTSLALSVHFMHPKLGMNDYEILSRATAFLLNVDPPDETVTSQQPTHTTKNGRQSKSAFPHLASNKASRESILQKQDYAYERASGPKRHDYQLNWLEFCPVNFRPRVHVVASSHVLSPWKWPQYYGQEWLREVNEEHVRYSLEVYKNVGEEEAADFCGEEGKLKGSFGPVAKFALNPYPIHHPNGLDVAVIHLKGEDDALANMKRLGIQPLNLHTMHQLENSTDPVFEPGEKVYFHGFEVYEANKVDDKTLSTDTSNNQDDNRTFHPYFALGTQSFGSPDRFLAKTAAPLPEGLCGGPVLTAPLDNKPMYIRGVVEGIVPPNHENAELAGAASFLPSHRVREFIDFAERIMLEQIVDPDIFKRTVDIKERKVQKDKVYGEDQANAESSKTNDDEVNDPGILANMEGTSDSEETPHLDKAYQEIVASLHKNHTPEEVDAILATVERERKEVIEIMEKGGAADVDEAIAQVRKRTYEERDRILRELNEEAAREENGVIEAEVIPKEDKTT